jgi:hypothetical protein
MHSRVRSTGTHTLPNKAPALRDALNSVLPVVSTNLEDRKMNDSTIKRTLSSKEQFDALMAEAKAVVSKFGSDEASNGRPFARAGNLQQTRRQEATPWWRG